MLYEVITGAPNTGSGLGSIARYVPPDTRQLILDAPAGPSRLLLKDLLNRAHCILIPVAPSAIDIRATAVITSYSIHYTKLYDHHVAARRADQKSVRDDLGVVVDGEISQLRLRHHLDEHSEVHFLPALSGG